ncbi:MAG: protein kinase [Actinomycetota bacterium]
MSSPPSRFDLPEQVGRYQLGSLLGAGGFAVVVRAHDEALAADVAIKILDRSRAADPEIRERFIREARLLRRVRSSAVVAVHDVGETPDGLPFFVMDLASGGTLEDRLAQAPGPAGAPDVRFVVSALVTGLGALHAAGVIHRDVKPSNLFFYLDSKNRGVSGNLISEGERLILGDLGLAKDLDATAFGPTMIGGTPLYQAPEQTELGELIDERTDVYSATAVIWRLVTGAPPPTPEELELQLMGAPEMWRAVLGRGIALRRQDRFATITEWGSALLEVLGSSKTPTPTVRAAEHGATCPYKGLAAFEAEDASLFFGRSQLVDQLVARLQGHSTLVIAGPSGSGKSSLLRAGLLAALARGGLPGSQNWRQVLFSPGTHPLERFDALLEEEPNRAVIAIDQFEEVFTLCADSLERQRFLDRLQNLAQPSTLVLALRADFYGACAAHPGLASMINENQLLVGPMSRAQLREAIEGPARRVGLRLEEGLADRILDEAGDDAGALPLMAHALVETWVRRTGSTLTLAGYESAGGVAGAISRTADELWRGFSSDERKAIRRIFLRLVHPGEGTPDTKRTATWAELGDDETTAGSVSALAAARLVTVDDRGVQLGHEAIIRSWGRLGVWLDESRDQIRARERIESAAHEWDRRSRDPDLLYRGAPLASALEWRRLLEEPPPEPSRSFLAAAEAARDAEEEAKSSELHRRASVRRRVLTALSALAALALLTSVVALVAFGRSRTEARRANNQLVRNLAASSMEQSAADPFLATVLATEALARIDPPLAEAREALVRARVSLGGGRPVPWGDPIPVGDAITVAANPEGSLAVTGHRDGGLVLWDLDRRRELARTDGPEGGIQKVAFSPDGSWAVAGGDDGTLWRWPILPKPGRAEVLRRLGSILWSVAVSPDGGSIATATEAGEVWLVDARTGEAAEPAGRNTGGFTSVAFSPDGESVLAGDGAGVVQVWSVDSRQLKFPPVQAHTSDVWELAVSPDSSRFLTVSSDGRSRLWDLAGGARQPGAPHDGPENAPEGLAGATFGPESNLILGGPDGRLYSWSPGEQRVTDVTGAGHSGPVTDVARSKERLVTLGADQTIRVWDLHERPGPFANLTVLEEDLYAVETQGRNLAVGTGNGEVLVLDAGSGEVAARLSGSSGRIFALSFAADGRLIAGDQRGTLREWDWRANQLVHEVPNAHEGAVVSLDWSSEGERLASAGADGVVRLWDADLSPVSTLGKLPGPLTDVEVDGRLIAASTASGRVALWDEGGRPLGTPVAVDDNTVWAVALSPDGTTMALATDDEAVSVWSLSGDDPEKVRDLTPHPGGALDVVFLDDRTLAASSRTGEVRLWDAGSGRALGPPLVNAGSPIWHLATGEEGLLWAASQSGAVVRIDVLVPQSACRVAAGSLDERQRERLLGDDRPLGCR